MSIIFHMLFLILRSSAIRSDTIRNYHKVWWLQSLGSFHYTILPYKKISRVLAVVQERKNATERPSHLTCQTHEYQARGEAEATNKKWDQELLNPQQLIAHEYSSSSSSSFPSKTSPLWTMGSALAQGMNTTKNPMAGALAPRCSLAQSWVGLDTHFL